MAYQRYSPTGDKHYIADAVADLVDLPIGSMGDTCSVIENGGLYTRNSKNEWIRTDIPMASVEQEAIDMSGYVTTDMLAKAIEEANHVKTDVLTDYVTKDALAKHSASKYEVRDLPAACSVDYRDKEIRIFCHDDAQYHKQNVGEGGNSNMYYMTFRSYGPANAAYAKEGDKGTIIDEVVELKTATDGRKYKDHWFALAMYDEASDSWTYFGKNSNASKYLGWTYVVEWYDENDHMINTDAIRINLSNKDCHNLLAYYYG